MHLGSMTMSDQPIENSSAESKLWGVSIRSWAACFVITTCTVTVCWLAIVEANTQGVMILASSAISFLFGKAAGSAQKP